jgi:hypothetical protein
MKGKMFDYIWEMKYLLAHIIILTVVAVPMMGLAQPVPVVDSPILDKPQSVRLEADTRRSWDLNKFFEMDDPREAAAALRKHAQQRGISLDDYEDLPALTVESEAPVSKRPQGLIRVFNGTEFAPDAGIERSLQSKTEQIASEAAGDPYIVAIIQTQGNMKMGEIIELLEADVKIFESTGRNAFIVRLPISSVQMLSARPYIRWIGEYKPVYKYASVPSESMNPHVSIYIFGGDRPAYRSDLQLMGIEVLEYDSTIVSYDVIMDISMFSEVAELWWVKGIHREPEAVPEAMRDISVNYEPDDSRELIMSYKNPAYNGSGVFVGVIDGGIYGSHPELSIPLHHDSNTSKVAAHGTHVSGIIAGRSKAISTRWGTSTVKGVAPGAGLLFKNHDDGRASSFSAFSNNSVQISNHSYGYTLNKFIYNSNTEAYDKYCDDDDMIIVKSAGNEYGSREITNPGTGKNVITVGSVYFATASSDVIGGVAAYSSKGPTRDDSRLKPDVVAPGGGSSYREGVVSTNADPWSISSYSGNINGNYGFPEWESDDNYVRSIGTSMAAPHVAGVFAIMKQWSPALGSELMKALLVNTTIPIKENSDLSLSGYANTKAGYGLVNAFSITHNYPGESERLLFTEDIVDEAGLQDDWSITVPAGTRKLAVTLAYNDEEGEVSNSNALKDDLDLILIDPDGNQHRADQHMAAFVTTESPLEKMVIVDPKSGFWTVKVLFSDSPGFNESLIFSSQKYGVVAHAIRKTPSLSVSPLSSITVSPGQDFSVQPEITNSGGYIAAGITVKVSGAASFGGDINTSKYAGNLLFEDDSLAPGINLTAPATGCSYTLTVDVDGINKEFDNASYPLTQDITVHVQPCFHSLDVARTGKGSGSVTSNPAGINCGDACSDNFTDGTTVILTAVPDAGSMFVGWSGEGCSGTGTCEVLIDADRSVTAGFVQVISAYPYSESFENGLGSWEDATEDTMNWSKTSNTTPTVSTGPSAAHDGISYLFTEASSHYNKTGYIDGAFDFSTLNNAALEFHYHMYGSAMGSLHVDVYDGTWHLDAWSISGQQHGSSGEAWTKASLDLSAYGGTGTVVLRFRGMTGNGLNSDMAIDNINIFDAANTCLLSTAVTGAGNGSVQSSPEGIACGNSCTEMYTCGTVVTLTAAPDTGTAFAGWSGDPDCSDGEITLSSDISCTAEFKLVQPLNVTKSGWGNGVVTTNPAGIDCGTDCSEVYDAGTVVTLTAVPDTGSSFVRWSGGCSGTETTCQVTMDTHKSVTARFFAPITSYPYSESFESGLGAWEDATDDNINWSISSEKTPSYHTGPSAAAHGTYYLYTEASNSNNPDKTANIDAVFDFSSLNSPVLEFFYHMYGADMGSLHVDVYDGSWHNDAWSISGEQHGSYGAAWTKASVDLSAYGGLSGITIRFRGITGKGYYSDMAIDNITVFENGGSSSDIIIDFGPQVGTYGYYNGTTWGKIHNKSPEIITVADMDGNGIEDAVMSFGATQGIWARYDNGSWQKLHKTSPEIIVTGDIDGNDNDDLVVDFGATHGIWAGYDDGSWQKLHKTSPEIIVTGDIDGNGNDDLVVDFGATHGIWAGYDDGSWQMLHKTSPEIIATGDVDGH